VNLLEKWRDIMLTPLRVEGDRASRVGVAAIALHS
jgi:hypothetical protein